MTINTIISIIVLLVSASLFEILSNERYSSDDGCLGIILGLRFKNSALTLLYLLLILAAYTAITWIFVKLLLSAGWILFFSIIVAVIAAVIVEIIALILIRLIIFLILTIVDIFLN